MISRIEAADAARGAAAGSSAASGCRIGRRRFAAVGAAAVAAAVLPWGRTVAAPATPTAADATRTVEHALGLTQVSARPRRVVVLDDGPLNTALALGIIPVGAATAFADGAFPAYLGDRVGAIEAVGTIEQPNLEAISRLDPDLILGSKVRHEDIYPELSAIAPTVFTERVGATWKSDLLLHTEAMGRIGDGERLLAEYEARLAAFREAMGDRLGETEVSVVRFLPDEVRVYQKATFSGVILADAGLPRPEAQDVDDFAIIGASKELIALMDGDVLFVTSYGPSEATPLASFERDPLWSRLTVVEAGNVHEVPDEYWMVGTGIIAANLVVDDLERYLLGEEPA